MNGIIASIFSDPSNPLRGLFEPFMSVLGTDAFLALFFGFIALFVYIGASRSEREGTALNVITAYFILVAAMCGVVLSSVVFVIFGIGAGIGVGLIIYKNWVE